MMKSGPRGKTYHPIRSPYPSTITSSIDSREYTIHFLLVVCILPQERPLVGSSRYRVGIVYIITTKDQASSEQSVAFLNLANDPSSGNLISPSHLAGEEEDLTVVTSLPSSSPVYRHSRRRGWCGARCGEGSLWAHHHRHHHRRP